MFRRHAPAPTKPRGKKRPARSTTVLSSSHRFLGAVSQAVIECGGQPNQFVGDGQLALRCAGFATLHLPRRDRHAARRLRGGGAMIRGFTVDELNQFPQVTICVSRSAVGIAYTAGEVIIGGHRR